MRGVQVLTPTSLNGQGLLKYLYRSTGLLGGLQDELSSGQGEEEGAAVQRTVKDSYAID